jgi:hypothetical protein
MTSATVYGCDCCGAELPDEYGRQDWYRSLKVSWERKEAKNPQLEDMHSYVNMCDRCWGILNQMFPRGSVQMAAWLARWIYDTHVQRYGEPEVPTVRVKRRWESDEWYVS